MKLTELSQTSALSSTDLMYEVNNTGSASFTLGQLYSYIKQQIGPSIIMASESTGDPNDYRLILNFV